MCVCVNTHTHAHRHKTKASNAQKNFCPGSTDFRTTQFSSHCVPNELWKQNSHNCISLEIPCLCKFCKLSFILNEVWGLLFIGDLWWIFNTSNYPLKDLFFKWIGAASGFLFLNFSNERFSWVFEWPQTAKHFTWI